MATDPDPADLLGRSADEGLLSGDAALMPSVLGHPTTLPEPHGRSVLVAAGVGLAGLTLLGGIALAVLGVVELLSGAALAGVAELWAGILLCATHWGWVHVAAWRNDRVTQRRHSGVSTDRQAWLASIEPYTRYEVESRVGDDGSITIETLRYQPVASSPGHFTFARTSMGLETHQAEEPAALIAERAELARRVAADRTAREHERYEAAAEARRATELAARDHREQLDVQRATAEALSEQINSKLRDPPLVE